MREIRTLLIWGGGGPAVLCGAIEAWEAGAERERQRHTLPPVSPSQIAGFASYRASTPISRLIALLATPSASCFLKMTESRRGWPRTARPAIASPSPAVEGAIMADVFAGQFIDYRIV